jgi:hypothetical protein
LWNESFFSAPQLKRDPLDSGMTFVHSPTLVSCAVGSTLTLLDLCLSQHFAWRTALSEFDTLRLPSGGSVLDALERRGLVQVCRDESGDIEKIHERVSPAAILQAVLEIGRVEYLRAAV